MGERLVIRRLVVVGPGKRYTVGFHEGINLITGPISTGKSSVLELVDYALGSKNPPSYPELTKCSDVLLEMEAGGEVLTIQRSLKSATAKAIVYRDMAEKVLAGSAQSSEVQPKYTRGAASISSEILTRLGLADIDVKSAPSQDASGISPYTLRDLGLLMYVDQSHMGLAGNAFYEEDIPRSIKWKAGFEIVHELRDESTTSLSFALKSAEEEASHIAAYLDHARQFLNQQQIPQSADIERRLEELRGQREALENQMRVLKEGEEAQLQQNLSLVRRRNDLDQQQLDTLARIAEIRRSLSQLGRLRVQYDRERGQLEFLKESEILVGSLPVVRCPSCFQELSEDSHGSDCYVCHRPLPKDHREVPVESRLRALNRRISDLENYLKESRAIAEQLASQRDAVLNEIKTLDASIQRVSNRSALPTTRSLLDASENSNFISNRIATLEEHLELRKKAQGEGSNLLAVQDRIRRIKQDLADAREQKPSPDSVISGLSQLFLDSLRMMHFPILQDCRVDMRTYLPIVRGQPYRFLLSKGAVALAISAWHLAVLRYSLENNSLFPRFLMLDSPLMSVGRDAQDDAFRDQRIVDGFYDFLESLQRDHGDAFQVIIVDNRPPKSAEHFIAVEFTGDPRSGRFGLIDDEKPAT